MLCVISPEEALALLPKVFPPHKECEFVTLPDAAGRVLFQNITAGESVPGFDRSTVDGFALRGSDTFGCSDSIPALLQLQGEIAMGRRPEAALQSGCCMAIPTGGALPTGADAVVMQEYAESYGDGTIAVSRPSAPGDNVIRCGEDVSRGQPVLRAGQVLTPARIGALAALGLWTVPVCRRPRVGILSTGDELVEVTEKPAPGQVRDVNSHLLAAMVRQQGAEPIPCGIVKDNETELTQGLLQALSQSNLVLVSGGSSVGAKDAVCRVLDKQGELLFHGLALKPGKPTALGKVGEKPVLGLPGHPGAACTVAGILLPALLKLYSSCTTRPGTVSAVLTEALSSNHGREEIVPVRLKRTDSVLTAEPLRFKSGLISRLAMADGTVRIPANREGLPAGTAVQVALETEEEENSDAFYLS